MLNYVVMTSKITHKCYCDMVCYREKSGVQYPYPSSFESTGIKKDWITGANR